MTHVDGDVVTVLNEDLAIIQLRLEISESMNGGETIVDNLPPTYGANNTVIPTNNKNIGLYLTNDYGQNKAALKISGSTSGALSSGTLIVNAAYIISI